MQTQSIEFPNPMIAMIAIQFTIQFTIHLLTITPSHHHAYTYSPPDYSHLDYSLTDQHDTHNKTIHYTQEVPVLQTQSIEFPNPIIAIIVIIVIQFTIYLLTITPSRIHILTT